MARTITSAKYAILDIKDSKASLEVRSNDNHSCGAFIPGLNLPGNVNYILIDPHFKQNLRLPIKEVTENAEKYFDLLEREFDIKTFLAKEVGQDYVIVHYLKSNSHIKRKYAYTLSRFAWSDPYYRIISLYNKVDDKGIDFIIFLYVGLAILSMLPVSYSDTFSVVRSRGMFNNIKNDPLYIPDSDSIREFFKNDSIGLGMYYNMIKHIDKGYSKYRLKDVDIDKIKNNFNSDDKLLEFILSSIKNIIKI